MVKRYEQSFKETLVELYDSGQSVPSLSSKYGIAQTTLYKWIDKYSKKGGHMSKLNGNFLFQNNAEEL